MYVRFVVRNEELVTVRVAPVVRAELYARVDSFRVVRLTVQVVVESEKWWRYVYAVIYTWGVSGENFFYFIVWIILRIKVDSGEV